MELRHLRYFVAVAEELHFRRAAERLHVAQPAVSEQVRKLEEELGVKLFDRTQRSVSLTPSGTAMLDEARRVLSQADIAQMAARNAHEHATTRLRIGYPSDFLPGSVARPMQVFAAGAPRVEISLETGPALRLIGELRAERLDAVVVGMPAPIGGLRALPVASQRLMVALPVTHPRAVESEISLDRLAPERVVVLPPDTNPAFHSAVVSVCHNAGLSPTFAEVAEPRLEHVLLAVASGGGIALLPESAAERHAAPGVRFVPLEAGAPAFESAVLTRPDTDNLATAGFLRALTRARRRPEAPARRPEISLAL
ncbi:MAG TPA: LysR substrate-binding domain-containing protein [Solirubrobacterales bacterium]|nr:LysR substrate-binding domain-containing protein [Solirubrobacterales bacterium]